MKENNFSSTWQMFSGIFCLPNIVLHAVRPESWREKSIRADYGNPCKDRPESEVNGVRVEGRTWLLQAWSERYTILSRVKAATFLIGITGSAWIPQEAELRQRLMC